MRLKMLHLRAKAAILASAVALASCAAAALVHAPDVAT
jgi:uncharacterized MnhB-related membrane protein